MYHPWAWSTNLRSRNWAIRWLMNKKWTFWQFCQKWFLFLYRVQFISLFYLLQAIPLDWATRGVPLKMKCILFTREWSAVVNCSRVSKWCFILNGTPYHIGCHPLVVCAMPPSDCALKKQLLLQRFIYFEPLPCRYNPTEVIGAMWQKLKYDQHTYAIQVTHVWTRP